ncbi:MAG: hypothetical protein Q7S34_04540 [bacterium]|nr:hypothetical protein [bacterium]
MQPENDLQKKFETLPEALKDALTSVDLSQKLQLIGKSQGLHLDQVDALMEEIGFVMLGETKPDEFGSKVASRLNLPYEKISPLVKSVDEEIFKPIRSSLVALHQKSATSGSPIGQTNSQTTLNTNVSGPDYDMSRDAILSAIENPSPADVKFVYVPHRTPETADPKEYILRHEDVVKNMALASQKTGGSAKKSSLTEEALLIAQKKASEKGGEDKAKIVVPVRLPTPQTNNVFPPPPKLATSNLTQKPTSLSSVPNITPINRPVMTSPQTGMAQPTLAAFSPRTSSFNTQSVSPPPPKASDKLTSVVQVPRTVSTITNLPPPSPPVKPSSDPYREPV